MTMNEEQYERIAWWLDGEDVTLTDDERRCAEDIRRGEALLAHAADVNAPRSALDGARRRMVAELPRPRWRVTWIAWTAAAAAVVLLAAGVLWIGIGPPKSQTSPEAYGVPLEVALEEMENAVDAGELDLLADELAELQADILVAADYKDVDAEIGAMENEIDSVLADDSAAWLDYDPGAS